MTTSMDCLSDTVHCKVRGVWGRARPGNVIKYKSGGRGE